jgi:hypothetical protein
MVLQLCGRVCRRLSLKTRSKKSGFFFFIGVTCRLKPRPVAFLWINPKTCGEAKIKHKY